MTRRLVCADGRYQVDLGVLELRPNCECCDVDLPPASTEAMICTYEGLAPGHGVEDAGSRGDRAG